MRNDANPELLQSTLAAHRHRGIGFVPTMGFLHEGHLSLIRTAKATGQFTVVSVFVNPAQFGPNEDLESYPREPERDYELSRQAGADLVWFPSVADLYAPGSETSVLPGNLSKKLCGLSRPNFFPGICTVVLKLFNLIRPDQAFFGEKDYQQLTIIRQMVRDFYLPTQVIGCPTVREEDGLAMSSRNAYLRPEDRPLALALFRTIERARALFAGGTRDAKVLQEDLKSSWPEGIELDYLELRHPTTLDEETHLSGESRLFLGAWLRGIRLIDNAALAP